MARRIKASHLMLVAVAGCSAFFVAARVSTGRGAAAEVVDAVATQQPRQASAPLQRASEPPTPASELALEERPRSIPSAGGEAFATLSWLPPPPPPPPPKAPPVPFSFVGMVENGNAAGKPQAFLTRGDALLVVGAGDVIENNTYRVETLNPNEVVMTYLPLNIRQTLSASGANR